MGSTFISSDSQPVSWPAGAAPLTDTLTNTALGVAATNHESTLKAWPVFWSIFNEVHSGFHTDVVALAEVHGLEAFRFITSHIV